MEARVVVAGTLLTLLGLVIFGLVSGILYEVFWTGVLGVVGLAVCVGAIAACVYLGQDWSARTKGLLRLFVILIAFALEALFAFWVFGMWYK